MHTTSTMRLFFFIQTILIVLHLSSLPVYSLRVSIVGVKQKFQDRSSSKFLRKRASILEMAENTWYEMEDSLVLLPQERIPRAIIHFIGGFLAGSSIQVAYSSLLSKLSSNGYLVVATPIPAVTLNHAEAAESCLLAFARTYSKNLVPLLGKEEIDSIPLIGLSHSLGGKLTVLNNIYQVKTPRYYRLAPPPVANIFLAFNNFGFKDAIDLSARQQNKKEAVANAEKSKDSSAAGSATMTVNQLLGSDNSWNTNEDSKDNDNGLSVRYRQRSNVDMDATASSTSTGSSAFESSSVWNNVGDWINTNIPNGIIRDVLDQAQSRISQELQNTDFTPSASQLWDMLVADYPVQYNYIVRFESDDIDQSTQLQSYLKQNTKCRVAQLLVTSGNHLTPNVLDLPTTSSQEDILAVEELTRKLLTVLFRASTDLWDKEKENIRMLQQLGSSSSKNTASRKDLPHGLDSTAVGTNNKNSQKGSEPVRKKSSWTNNSDLLDKQWAPKPKTSTFSPKEESDDQ